MKIFWLHVNGISQVSHQWWNIWIIYKIIIICSFGNVFASSLRAERRRYIFHFFFHNICDVYCLGTAGVYLQQLSPSTMRKFGFLLLKWFEWKSIFLRNWYFKDEHFVINLQIHNALSIKVPIEVYQKYFRVVVLSLIFTCCMKQNINLLIIWFAVFFICLGFFRCDYIGRNNFWICLKWYKQQANPSALWSNPYFLRMKPILCIYDLDGRFFLFFILSLTKPFFQFKEKLWREVRLLSMHKVCKRLHIILTFGIVMTKWPVVCDRLAELESGLTSSCRTNCNIYV